RRQAHLEASSVRMALHWAHWRISAARPRERLSALAASHGAQDRWCPPLPPFPDAAATGAAAPAFAGEFPLVAPARSERAGVPPRAGVPREARPVPAAAARSRGLPRPHPWSTDRPVSCAAPDCRARREERPTAGRALAPQRIRG